MMALGLGFTDNVQNLNFLRLKKSASPSRVKPFLPLCWYAPPSPSPSPSPSKGMVLQEMGTRFLLPAPVLATAPPVNNRNAANRLRMAVVPPARAATTSQNDGGGGGIDIISGLLLYTYFVGIVYYVSNGSSILSIMCTIAIGEFYPKLLSFIWKKPVNDQASDPIRLL